MEYAPLPVADPPLSIKPDLPFGSPSWLEHFRAKIREMFFHAFGAYLQHAYPKDELRPLSCAGEDNFGGTQATLIDSLDTLAVLGEWDLLRSCLSLARSASFDGDADVSVFETNIRILGGLLSAHLAAQRGVPGYSGHLLSQAHDLGRRLLRAFASSSTGMPYGTVNLRTGIKRGETESTCTACVGTYALEFSWLSLLTGDASFERASRRAVRALARSATPLGLYGGHVNITSGEWIHAEASVGADSDSFYEYLFKAHFAFADEAEYGPIAAAALEGIRTHLKKGVWHFDVHASNGQTVFPWHHSLAAFFPGLKVLRGDLLEAQDELWSSRMIMDRCGGFLPEQFDLRSASPVAGRSHYPLRPEFAESAWALHRATRDPWLLDWAARFAADLDTRTRVGCGFAGLADVGTGELADRMDSFLLSETLKYLYLVFDAGNEYNGPPNGRDWVFTTEAHPLPVTDRRGWRGGRWVGVDRRRRKRRAGPESPPPPPAPPFSDPGTRTFESPAMVSAIHAESVGAYRERSRAAWEAGVCLYDEWVEATHGRIWGRTVGGMRIRG
ncbi:glycoside hydrolase [Hyaloraphidium curvatum]|nr:glycoside hydrolase [Hyaloraphidium curvatum]